ncbi:MAG: class I SAM-dependent methyltransferase [Actinobacteria bacterium]|nr:class I SAM-dependent methyltransferase [Actinomycetota bacterium]
MSSYKERLFTTYHSTHVAHLDSDDQEKLEWFLRYARDNYLTHIDHLDRDSSRVLEIGCNKGYLLSALNSFGFKNLSGVDLSPDDVQQAQRLVPSANIVCSDAFLYLNDHEGSFDVIILKAVLEHLQKDDVLPLLEKIKKGLTSGGIIIVDVPNMDWLFAPHERYMDFTHEAGFTKESLRQVMNQIFTSVQIHPIESIYLSSFRAIMKKRIARFILYRLLLWAEPEGAANPIWARGIMGIGKR